MTPEQILKAQSEGKPNDSCCEIHVESLRYIFSDLEVLRVDEKKWRIRAIRAENRAEAAEAMVREMVEALHGARLQIEYLHGKFCETGTGNAELANIRAVLARAEALGVKL